MNWFGTTDLELFGTLLERQHLGGRGGRIRSSKPASATGDPVFKIKIRVADSWELTVALFAEELEKLSRFDLLCLAKEQNLELEH